MTLTFDSYRERLKIQDTEMTDKIAKNSGNWTRSRATAERPRDALCQLKSCQLLHSCTKNHM